MTDEIQKDRSNLSHSTFGPRTGAQPFPSPNILLWASVACLAYFITANLIGAYRTDFPIIGVFIELCTIPAFFLAVGCFVFSLILWAKNQYNIFTKPFYALLVLCGLVVFFIFL